MNSDKVLQLISKQLEINSSSVSKSLNKYYERLVSRKGRNPEDVHRYLKREYRTYLILASIYGIAFLSLLVNHYNHSGDLLTSNVDGFDSKMSILKYLHSNMSNLLYIYSIFLIGTVVTLLRAFQISSLLTVTRENEFLTKLIEELENKKNDH